jgi:hypothetical protein
MPTTTYTPSTSVTVLAPPVVIAGVNTNSAGVVGTATKGPVGVATAITGNQFQSVFGAPVARKYDGGTIVAEAALNGASTIVFVRVSDGTDTVANASINNAALVSTSTGSGWNGTTVQYIAAGKANAITVAITAPGSAIELFQNLPASNAAVFWAAHDLAINAGGGVLRGPSLAVRSNSANATVLPTLPSTATLSGGTDGANLSNASALIGQDTGASAKGMYALRGSGVSAAVLADCDDATTFTTQAAFGISEFIHMGCVLPAGSTVAGAVAARQSAGVDSFEATVLHGNWLTYNDTTYGLRKVSPQGFWLGTRTSLNPNESALNKPMNGIAGSERQTSGGPFTVAETDALFGAGINVIDNPIPVGAAWGLKGDYNSSSNPATNSDAYTSMTNFLAQTFRKAGGPWVGEANNAQNRSGVAASFSHFLNGLVSNEIIDAGSYSVVCDLTNNTQDGIVLGYLNVNVNVRYQGIIRFFNVALQGGAGVVITSTAA